MLASWLIRIGWLVVLGLVCWLRVLAGLLGWYGWQAEHLILGWICWLFGILLVI